LVFWPYGIEIPYPVRDVRLTQANLGLFFPLFGFRPTISAHARAALEGEVSTNSAPIAVGDSGFTPCVSVKLVNGTTNSVIQTVTLSKEPPDPNNPTAPVQWDNSASPVSFQMPNSDNVYLQPFLSDCNGNGQTYDDSKNTGLLMINNHPSNPTVNSGSPPQIDNVVSAAWSPDSSAIALVHTVNVPSRKSVTGYEEDQRVAVLNVATGRETQSIAFFSEPGMDELYSGVENRTASASPIALRKAATAIGAGWTSSSSSYGGTSFTPW